MRILLVEDEPKMAELIRRVLVAERHVVDRAGDAVGALSLATAPASVPYDVLVLDRMLPDLDGLDLLRLLRTRGIRTPALMLTALGGVEERVAGLDAGADDYLAKPFRFEELLARIRALGRRGGAERMEVLRFGEITLDRLRHIASVGQHKLDLTAKEFQLLEYFLLHLEEVVRRTTLLEKVWDMHFDPESNVVDVHVGNLRRKLAAHTSTERIETVRGVGFCLRHASQAESAPHTPQP
jgi:two-component system OmpR family response regulator